MAMNTIEDPLFPDGFATPGYEFLSNFYPATLIMPAYAPAIPLYLHGRRVATLEHAYQAARCAEAPAGLKLLAAPTPGRAKRGARRVRTRPDWPAVKVSVMRCLLRQKFGEHPDLRRRLAATYPRPLTEWNTWGDTFWGKAVPTGQGENWLGRLLEEVRAAALAAEDLAAPGQAPP